MDNCPSYILALSNILEHFLGLLHVSAEQCLPSQLTRSRSSRDALYVRGRFLPPSTFPNCLFLSENMHEFTALAAFAIWIRAGVK